VELILDLLGLTSKSSGIPKGQYPTTFMILCRLLFHPIYQIDDLQEGVQYSLKGFYKVYFFTLGLMSKLIGDCKKGSLIDITSILDLTSQYFENIFLGFKEISFLDRYLVEVTGVDINDLCDKNILQIWLPDNCEKFKFSGDTKLYTIINKFAISKRIDLKEYHLYYTNGKLIPEDQLNLSLSDFGKYIVYFMPQTPQHQSFYLLQTSKLQKRSKSHAMPIDKKRTSHNRKSPRKKQFNRLTDNSSILYIVQQELDNASEDSD